MTAGFTIGITDGMRVPLRKKLYFQTTAGMDFVTAYGKNFLLHGMNVVEENNSVIYKLLHVRIGIGYQLF